MAVKARSAMGPRGGRHPERQAVPTTAWQQHERDRGIHRKAAPAQLTTTPTHTFKHATFTPQQSRLTRPTPHAIRPSAQREMRRLHENREDTAPAQSGEVRSRVPKRIRSPVQEKPRKRPRSGSQPASRSASQPASQPVNQPVFPSVSQSAHQPAHQSTSQPVSPPVNWPANHTHN